MVSGSPSGRLRVSRGLSIVPGKAITKAGLVEFEYLHSFCNQPPGEAPSDPTPHVGTLKHTWELEGCPPSPPLTWRPWSTKRGAHQSPAGSGPAPSLGVAYGPSGASLGWVEIPSDSSGGAMTPSWERTASRDAQKPLDEGPAHHWSWPVRTHTGCFTSLSPFSPQLA